MFGKVFQLRLVENKPKGHSINAMLLIQF